VKRDVAERVGGAHHLRPYELQARGGRGQHEQRQSAGAGVRVRAREHHVEVGDAGVGDQGLAAVEHVLVAVADGGRADRADIGPGPRLAHRKGAHGGPAHGRLNPGGGHLFVVRQQDRSNGEALQRNYRVCQWRGGSHSLTQQAQLAQVAVDDRSQPAGVAHPVE